MLQRNKDVDLRPIESIKVKMSPLQFIYEVKKRLIDLGRGDRITENLLGEDLFHLGVIRMISNENSQDYIDLVISVMPFTGNFFIDADALYSNGNSCQIVVPLGLRQVGPLILAKWSEVLPGISDAVDLYNQVEMIGGWTFKEQLSVIEEEYQLISNFEDYSEIVSDVQ